MYLHSCLRWTLKHGKLLIEFEFEFTRSAPNLIQPATPQPSPPRGGGGGCEINVAKIQSVMTTPHCMWWPSMVSVSTHPLYFFQEPAHFRDEALLWRHNGSDGVSNHQPRHCLLNRLFRRQSKKASKLRFTGLCAGDSPVTGEFPHKGPATRKMFPFDDVIIKQFYWCDVGTMYISFTQLPWLRLRWTPG